MVVMCSLLRTSRNRYLRTRTLSRIVLLLFPQASRCCLYREAAFLFYRLAARRCRADGTSRTPSPTGSLSCPPRRAGPMCPALRYACFPAGHAGPALQDSGTAALTGRRTPRAFVPLCSTAGSSPTPVYRRRSPQETGCAARRQYGAPRGGSPPRCSHGWSWRRCRCARRWSGRGSACRRARSSCSG